MADRAEHRAERIAGEQAAATASARRRRTLLTAGAAAVAIAIIAVVVLLLTSSSGTGRSAGTHSAQVHPGAATAQATLTAAQGRVTTLLAGIPEASDDTLGRASAPVTIIEYGDLECAVCDSFALAQSARVSDGTHGTGIEDAIIDMFVKTGRAKLVYDALDTATADGATPGEFVDQQAAAYAAGQQGKAWYYIELFYNEQHPEGTHYVNRAFLDGIAKQIPGLDYAQWQRASTSARLRAQVRADVTRGDLVTGGAPATPTVVVQSKTDGVIAAQGIPTVAQVQQAINAVQ